MPERDVTAVLAEHWSGRLGAEASWRLLALPGGTEGAPLRLDAGGHRYVVRRRPDTGAGRLTAALAASGAAWRSGVGAPRPLPTDAGEAFATTAGGLWTLVTWVPGRARRRWTQLAGADATMLGQGLARLHAALRTLPPDVAGPGSVPPPLHGRPADQVLHGDPSQGNVLWSGAPGARRIAFIDFDRVDRGPVERDLARALVGLAPWAAPGQPHLAGALLAGYARTTGRAVHAGRLLDALAVVLEEGEQWLGEAQLGAQARRRGERWLERARTVRLSREDVEAVAALARTTASTPGNAP